MPQMNNPRTVKIYLNGGAFIRGVAEAEVLTAFKDRVQAAGPDDLISGDFGGHEIVIAKAEFAGMAIRPPRGDHDDFEDDDEVPAGNRRNNRQYNGGNGGYRR